LQNIREKLEAHYGDRLRDVVLYGSEARGVASSDSDIDVLCILDGPINVWNELETIIDATYSLQLEYLDRMIHIMPCSNEDYEQGKTPFLRFAREEGITLCPR